MSQQDPDDFVIDYNEKDSEENKVSEKAGAETQPQEQAPQKGTAEQQVKQYPEEDLQDQQQQQIASEDKDAQASKEQDLRSVYVQNVDYSCSKEDLQEHFKDCGKIVRVTILLDKYTGCLKGGAYIEFEDQDAVEQAKLLSDSILKGRQIKVMNKRTNIHNFFGRGRAKSFRPGQQMGKRMNFTEKGRNNKMRMSGYHMFNSYKKGRWTFQPYH